MLRPSGLLHPIPATLPALGLFPAPGIPSCHCQRIIPKHCFCQVPRFLKPFFFFKWLKLSPNSACLWNFPIPWELPPPCLLQNAPTPTPATPFPGQSLPRAPLTGTPSPYMHYTHFFCQTGSVEDTLLSIYLFSKPSLNYAGPYWSLLSLLLPVVCSTQFSLSLHAVFHGPLIVSCILVSSSQ